MSFLPYENVPLYLSPVGGSGEYIFAESASISVSQSYSDNKQMDDTLFPICAYGDGSNMSYTSKQFTANSTELVVLGPSSGPPQPLATSFSKIPKDTKITFPGAKHLFFTRDVVPDGHNFVVDVYAKSGGWSLTEEDAQQGYFEGIYHKRAKEPVKGSMDVSFYLGEENLKHFFNITGLVDPAQFPPVNEDRLTGHLGNFCFEHAYLKQLSFSLAPNALVQAEASFDVFGKLTKSDTVLNNYFETGLYRQESLPHADTSQLMGTTTLGVNHPTSFSYQISVNRTPRFSAPTSDTVSDASLIPTRVSKHSTNISINIEGDSLDPSIFSDGYSSNKADVKIHLYDLNYTSFGDKAFFEENHTNGLLQTFSCNGVVTNQNLSVNSAGHLRGSLSIEQKIN